MSKATGEIDIESYILYEPPSGGDLHRNPDCATTKGLETQLDAAASKLEQLAMHRVKDLDINKEDVCASCGEHVRRHL
jgi:multimeric flavodoxin WrbA